MNAPFADVIIIIIVAIVVIAHKELRQVVLEW